MIEDFLGLLDNSELCRVKAMFRKSLDVDVEVGLDMLDERVEAIGAIQRNIMNIMEHESDRCVWLLNRDNVSMP